MREVTNFDAIVVGAGISGGWAAKELAERGLTTLVLEAGGPVDPRTDFVEHVQPWEMHFRGLAIANRSRIADGSARAGRCPTPTGACASTRSLDRGDSISATKRPPGCCSRAR